jgi:hypothetical protein
LTRRVLVYIRQLWNPEPRTVSPIPNAAAASSGAARLRGRVRRVDPQRGKHRPPVPGSRERERVRVRESESECEGERVCDSIDLPSQVWGSAFPMPRALRWSCGGRRFLMSEVPLYSVQRLAFSVLAFSVEGLLRGRVCRVDSQPPSGLRRDFRPILGRKSVTCSVGTPLRPYGIAYRRV